VFLLHDICQDITFWIPLCHSNLSLATRHSFPPANVCPLRPCCRLQWYLHYRSYPSLKRMSKLADATSMSDDIWVVHLPLTNIKSSWHTPPISSRSLLVPLTLFERNSSMGNTKWRQPTILEVTLYISCMWPHLSSGHSLDRKIVLCHFSWCDIFRTMDIPNCQE